MAAQRHVIKRQVIELTVRQPAAAYELQTEVSRIYRQRIVPLIDEYCTALSGPDCLHRIDRLEIEVGAIDPAHLEAELLEKVRAPLRQALAARIGARDQENRRAAQSTQARSQLELFACFARTGGLPWWVDPSQPRLVDACLSHLLAHSPEALRRLLQRLVREPGPLARIVHQVAEERLAELAGLLIPRFTATLSQDAPALVALVQRCAAAFDRPSARLRQSAWRNLLHVAGLGGPQYDTLQDLYRAVLKRVAVDAGATYDALIGDLQRIVHAGGANIGSRLRDALDELSHDRLRAKPAASEETGQRLARMKAAGGALADIAAALRPLMSRLPEAVQAEWLVVLRDIEERWSTRGSIHPETGQRLLSLVDGIAAQQPLALSVRREVLAALSRSPPAESPATDEWALESQVENSEELYVDNAGLVVLWPFLGHFFARAGLLDEKQFEDAAARQRAVGLLQYLATGEASFPEYLLPLNKVLCGMAPEAVFDFGAEITAQEMEDCNDLLAAVILQAPILNGMSLPGFRASFLLRKGQLGTRDGNWLLRVERETHDIVLDRFPWGFGIVKLPWMEALMQVEW